MPLSYTLIAALIIAVAAYFTGREHGLSDYYTYKSSVEAAQAALKADAENARQESARVTADVSQSWSAALEYQRTHPAVRVRDNCSAGGLRPSAATGLKLDATTKESGLGSSVDVAVEQCEQRLNDAALDAAMVMHLQHWIRQQHEVKR
jgi:hypothetical protein